ncbi:hypothetical protein [Harryflintia acetispora]|uniref:hypothetical protein n=1 Tax=Harryflintia acetispora TaxID=1849041 RepID=UPI0014047EF4|nr:hypothetical protein [Harryflintia acetispora]
MLRFIAFPSRLSNICESRGRNALPAKQKAAATLRPKIPIGIAVTVSKKAHLSRRRQKRFLSGSGHKPSSSPPRRASLPYNKTNYIGIGRALSSAAAANRTKIWIIHFQIQQKMIE